MKTYMKPKLVALSLSGNDALCACKFDVREPNLNPYIELLLKGMNVSIAENPFTNDAMECKKKIDLEEYCKFSPTAETTVFNS